VSLPHDAGVGASSRLTLRRAGKTALAKAAARKVKYWLRLMIVMKTAAKQGKLQEAR
jgi:hypothetical protein